MIIDHGVAAEGHEVGDAPQTGEGFGFLPVVGVVVCHLCCLLVVFRKEEGLMLMCVSPSASVWVRVRRLRHRGRGRRPRQAGRGTAGALYECVWVVKVVSIADD